MWCAKKDTENYGKESMKIDNFRLLGPELAEGDHKPKAVGHSPKAKGAVKYAVKSKILAGGMLSSQRCPSGYMLVKYSIPASLRINSLNILLNILFHLTIYLKVYILIYIIFGG